MPKRKIDICRRCQNFKEFLYACEEFAFCRVAGENKGEYSLFYEKYSQKSIPKDCNFALEQTLLTRRPRQLKRDAPG